MRPLDPRLLRHARAAIVPIAVVIAAGAVTTGCVIAQAWLLGTGIANAFTDRAELSVALLTALASVIAVRAAAAWTSEAAAHRAAAAAKSGLRRDLLRAVIASRSTARPALATGTADATGPAHATGPGQAISTARATGTAETTELATSGLDALDGYFTGYLPALVLAMIVPLAVVVAIAVADPVSGITVAVTLPLVPLFGEMIGRASGREARSRQDALATLAHHFHDVVAGLPTLKVFGRAAAQRERIRQVTGEYRVATMGTLRLAFLSGFALELVATMSVALVATEIGLRLAYGHLGLRVGLIVLILAPEAYLPLRTLGARFHAAADGVAAAEKALATIEAAPEPAPELASGLALAAEVRYAGAPTITVDGLTVRHSGRPAPAPDGLSLTVAPGRITAVTGPSGCGKTTLLSVLLGFTAPDAGRVTVTHDGGIPLDPASGGTTLDPGTDGIPLHPGAIRAAVGWLPQNPVLFPGAVGANIRLGWPDAPDAAVAEAARKAALDDVPLDRVLGEHGGGLSEGQRRRVALARALLPPRPILLLDEPTAGVDPARETVITATLRAEASAGRAVLVVSHRPVVAEAADEVVEIVSKAVRAAGTVAGDVSTVGRAAGQVAGAADEAVPAVGEAVLI